jgi:hypothetical protein
LGCLALESFENIGNGKRIVLLGKQKRLSHSLFKQPETDADYEYIGRCLVQFGHREMHQQDSRGWNRLYNRVMQSFTNWRTENDECAATERQEDSQV